MHGSTSSRGSRSRSSSAARSGESPCERLTTAAAVWLSALLGTAAGAGAYALVIVALVLALAAIACGGPFERWFRRFQSPRKPTDPEDTDL